MEQNLSYADIAKVFHVSITPIRNYIRKLGIQRTLAEAHKVCQGHKGNRNPAWRGGKRKDHGYIYVYKPDHPIAKRKRRPYVAEHIIVWEDFHGRALPLGWIVHHLNGKRSDNRPKNLFALPRKGHSPALNAKEVQRRLREVEAELRKLQTQSRMNIF